MDWLSFTVSAKHFAAIPADGVALFKWWCPTVNIAEESKGMRNFYEHARVVYAMVGFEAVEIGHVGHGGASQRETVNVVLNGGGCALVDDWSVVAEYLNSVDAHISRVDVAIDFLDGEFTVDDAATRYLAGDFNYTSQPTVQQVGPWLNGDPHGRGRTLVVGSRKNGKCVRIYEKGKFTLKNPDSPWNRVEVELHNVDRVVPYGILTNPTPFFAGAYPFFNELVDLEGERISLSKDEYDITVEAYTEFLKLCQGKWMTALRSHFRTDTDMLNALCVAGIPKRLHKPSLKLIRNDPLPSMAHASREEFEFGSDQRAFRTAM